MGAALGCWEPQVEPEWQLASTLPPWAGTGPEWAIAGRCFLWGQALGAAVSSVGSLADRFLGAWLVVSQVGSGGRRSESSVLGFA